MQPTNLSISRSLHFFEVKAPAQDASIPALPEDLTELDDRALTELFNRLAAWCEFADQTLADAKGVEYEAEKNLARQLAQHTSTGDRKTTVTAQRAAATLDQRVQHAEGILTQAYKNRLRAESAVKLTDRRHGNVWREMTRRSSSMRGRLS